MKKKIIIGLVIALVAGGAYGLYLWNKPKRTSASEEATASLPAAALYAAFSADAAAANAKYLDKVIEVSGIVSTVETSSDGIITITLDTDDPMAAVTCTFSPGTSSTAAAGQPITLKGICSGIQGDMMPAVILSQCTQSN
ncbi:MAG: OB-fold protein [Flavobacteriales bacterium]